MTSISAGEQDGRIHLAVQMVLAMALHEHGQSFFNTPTFFLAYVAGTCLLGYAVYRMFALPAQNWLRRFTPVERRIRSLNAGR